MSNPIFKSTPGEFLRKNDSFLDMVQGHMGMDIEALLKTSAGMPVDTGNMKSQTRHFKNDRGHWRVEVDVQYAGYQELGMRRDGSYVVHNYTTAGTSAGFFQRSIDAIISKREHYIAEASKALGL